MLDSKIYATLAIALTFASAAPAQAGWNGWQLMAINENAHPQHSTIAPAPAYRGFAQADWSRTRRIARASSRR